MHSLRTNFYTTLALPSPYSATPHTIWQSYLAQARSLHPSQIGFEPCAHEARAQLERAIDTLGCPSRREKYDLYLQREICREACFLRGEVENVNASLGGMVAGEVRERMAVQVPEYAGQVDGMMERLEVVRKRVGLAGEWLGSWLARCPVDMRLEMTDAEFQELQMRCGEARMCRMFIGTLERLVAKVEEGNVGQQATWWGGLERIVKAFEELKLEKARGV